MAFSAKIESSAHRRHQRHPARHFLLVLLVIFVVTAPVHHA